MIDIETLIIKGLLDRLPYPLSIHDGEEFQTKNCLNRDVIEACIGLTEITVLHTSIGQVVLVHGNGEDLIHDCTDNPKLTEIIDDILASC